jgi:Mn-containing catalase
MFMRIDRLQAALPGPAEPNPNEAAALQELLGGKYGEMSTLGNYMFQSFYVKRWTDDLVRRIAEGELDPSFVITHTVSLEEGPEMYRVFRDKEDACIKVVIKPN